MLRRPRAMTAPGMVLSHPTRHTTASNECPRHTSSMLSAITSRLMSEDFMPSVPIETPSDTDTVLNSIGVPPAFWMPTFTCFARSRWLMLHGMVSIHVVATPTMGFARASSSKPMALSMARAGARSGPSVMTALFRFAGSVGCWYGLGFVMRRTLTATSRPVRGPGIPRSGARRHRPRAAGSGRRRARPRARRRRCPPSSRRSPRPG